MGIVGIVGYAYMRDWNWTAAFAIAQTKIYETGRNYTLSVVPLFILMGNFVTRAGMSQAVPRRLRLHRPPARRPRHGDDHGVRRVRRHLRLVHRHRGDHGEGRLPVDEALRLLRPPRHRRIASAAHLGIMIPPSTIMGLRRVHRDQHRHAVRRRHPAGDPRRRASVRRRALRHLARPERRAAGRALELARALAGDPADLGGRAFLFLS